MRIISFVFEIDYEDGAWKYPIAGLQLLSQFTDHFPTTLTKDKCWTPLIKLLSHDNAQVKELSLEILSKTLTAEGAHLISR